MKMKNKKEVRAMKNIISEVARQLKYPNLPNKASNLRLNQSLSILGFDEIQIRSIQTWG